MICKSGNYMLLCLWALSVVIFISIAPEVSASSVGFAEDENERDEVNKRGWKDVSGSWGKRGWNDLQGTWGKRAWNNLNGAWGKRQAEDVDAISKVPEWAKYRGYWPKPGGDRDDVAAWGHLRGLWAKRAWDKLGGSWGKRYDNEAEYEFN